MPRIRSIKPDFFKSEDVSALPLRARLTWIGLWTQCDDHGRYKDSARLIKGDLWSLDDVSLRDIEEDLAVLAAARRIVRYEVNGSTSPTGQLDPGAGKYLAVVNWHVHQSINRPSKAKYPGPPSPTGVTNPEHPAYCAECASQRTQATGSGREQRHTGLAPAGHYAPEPRETGTRPVDNPFATPSLNGHGVLTPGGEGKGREGKGRAREPRERSPTPDKPPSPKCPNHVNQRKPPACGQCADARKALAEWEAERNARQRDMPDCRLHRGQLAHNCAGCRADQLAADA